MSSDPHEAESAKRDRDGGLKSFHPVLIALLLPPLAAVLLLAVYGAWPIGGTLVASTLAPAYLIGAGPSLIGGWLDLLLARKRWHPISRLSVAAGMGFLAGLALLLPLSLSGMIGGSLPLRLPFALALAAAVALGLVLALNHALCFIRR